MRDLLRNVVGDQPDPVRRRNLTREYLQSRILLALQDHGAFTDWAFVGGTSLRFLFQLPRYSEDLDFSLTTPGRDARFAKLLGEVKADLEAEAYEVEVRTREQGAVASAMVKFRGLLYDIGVSPHRNEAIAVKVKIDTNPPAGAGLTSRVIRRQFLLNLLHYDRASLFAGKLHAVLTRKYTKGRDLYDLAWYLSDPDWPAPNLTLLNNALAQTGRQGPALGAGNWRQAVAERLSRMEWGRVYDDVKPFLERPQDAALLAPSTFDSLLGSSVADAAV